MYERFYGLRERPFGLTPDPRYLLLTESHAEALSTLHYGISSRAGVILVTGEAGTGKTTVLRAALASQPSSYCFAMISNPTLNRAEFVECLAHTFGLNEGAAQSKAKLLVELRGLLERRSRNGVHTALVVDEAHKLSDELLEEVRLLVNIETDTEKLLSVVLTGQPELGERLNTIGLRQLKQRVALRCALRPLELRETAAYIAGRIRLAGGEAVRLFTREAVQTIHEFSHGIPRTISAICDNALVAGFAVAKSPVTRDLVSEACRSLDLTACIGRDKDRVEAGSVTEPETRNAVVEATNDAALPSADQEDPARDGSSMFSFVAARRRFSLF